MATVKPGPSNGSTALTRTAAAPPADPALVSAARRLAPPLFCLAKYR
jgi:hypothetical protein